jgi:hypothetical protein
MIYFGFAFSNAGMVVALYEIDAAKRIFEVDKITVTGTAWSKLKVLIKTITKTL